MTDPQRLQALATARLAAIRDLLAEVDSALVDERTELLVAEARAARRLAKLRDAVAGAPDRPTRLKASISLATLQARSVDRQERLAELDAGFRTMAIRYRRRGLPAASIAALTGLPPHLCQLRPKPSDGDTA